MRSRLTLVALAIPILGMLAVVGRAEFASRGGVVWTIPIEGFDPRDPLHGQYLEYRYRVRWHGPNTCGDDSANPVFDVVRTGCCLCLQTDRDSRVDPGVRQIHCDERPPDCDAVVQADPLSGRQRYFVPEDRAQDLERALRDRPAAIEFRVAADGLPATGELLLDGRPWRDALGQ